MARSHVASTTSSRSESHAVGQGARARKDHFAKSGFAASHCFERRLVESDLGFIASDTDGPREGAPCELGVTLFIVGDGVERTRDDSAPGVHPHGTLIIAAHPICGCPEPMSPTNGPTMFPHL